MSARLPNNLRSHIDRLVVVLVTLAFLSIPVQCDAASGPHSVFLSPAEAGVSNTGSTARETGDAIDHADHRAEQAVSDTHDADHHHDSTEGETDIASQRSAGSGFDAPFNVQGPSLLGADTTATGARELFTHLNGLIQQTSLGPVTPPPQ